MSQAPTCCCEFLLQPDELPVSSAQTFLHADELLVTLGCSLLQAGHPPLTLVQSLAQILSVGPVALCIYPNAVHFGQQMIQ